MHDDFAFEPIRGLPGRLPRGESLVWQGAPDWWALACRVFHIRAVALYGLVMVAWRVATMLHDGNGLGVTLAGAAELALIMAVPVALLAGIAWGTARTAVYSITTRRVVLRIGIALTVSINLPYKRIENVDLKLHRNGVGSIALRLTADDRVSYLVLWPHVRPGRVSRAEPMIRLVPDAQAVATRLVEAMTAARDDSPAAAAGTPAPVANDDATAAVARTKHVRTVGGRRPMRGDIEFAAGDD